MVDQLAATRRTLGEFGGVFESLGPPPLEERPFERDRVYERSPGVRETFTALKSGEPAVMVVGRAGTGKTKLVQYLKCRPGGERQVVLAPTGIAAINALGQTINSFFQLPPRVINLDELKPQPGLRRFFQRIERVVIDEISMVRADLLDAVDCTLRINRENEQPFGGVQMLFVGDFLQLPPVVSDEEKRILECLGYRSQYAFHAHSLASLPVSPIELDEVYRQQDRHFIELLGRLRIGERVQETLDDLNNACCRPHREDTGPVILTPTRQRADRYNRNGLENLPGDPVTFLGIGNGKFDVQRHRLPAPEALQLKVGARVMAVKNDSAKRWVNGSLGTVTRLAEKRAWVRFDRHGEEVEVRPVVWENLRYAWREERIESEAIGTYTQIPLVPAWAITIHKAQGLTLEDVRIDLGWGTFASGQVYVALSRAKSLEGLSFARPIRAGEVLIDPTLVEFGKWLLTRQATEAASDRF